MNEQLKILMLSAEMVPFAKTGGLADVTGALPKALQEHGHDVRVAMPRYGRIDPERFQASKHVAGPTRCQWTATARTPACCRRHRFRQRRCAGLL